MRRARAIALRVLVAMLATCGALVIAEMALHAFLGRDRFYPYDPNTVYLHGPFDPKITLGVEGYARFTTNRFGCRGTDRQGEKHGLLVVGGSTANCIELDDGEAWPYLLMQDVNARLGERTLWVTSSAKEGRNSRHHVMHARYLLPKIPGLDHVLYYCGLNDVAKWLNDPAWQRGYLDDEQRWNGTIGEAFQISDFHDPSKPWYKDLELIRVCQRLQRVWEEKTFEAEKKDYILEQDYQAWMEQQREKRRAHGTVLVEGRKLASLPAAEEEYAENLRRIIRWTRAAGAEPILMAQYVHLVGVSEEEDAHLWVTLVDGGPRYADSAQLEELVAGFNQTMRRVAADEQVPFIELPALLQGRERLCHDGVHFNEEGARVVADVVARWLVDEVYRAGG